MIEVFSPPRVGLWTKAFGLGEHAELDRRTVDGEGTRWDFDCPKRSNYSLALVRAEQPALIIGSPECTAFSCIQNLNQHNIRDPGQRQEQMQKAREHLIFSTCLYIEQVRAGRLFLHEHPAQASSWSEGCVQ